MWIKDKVNDCYKRKQKLKTTLIIIAKMIFLPVLPLLMCKVFLKLFPKRKENLNRR